jgi:simple sugar transport system ATP-binding protein
LARAQVQVAELARRHRLDVDPNAAGRDLSVGVRQRVEILKTLYRDTRILILDELTAALTSPERDALFLASYEASSPRGDRWF